MVVFTILSLTSPDNTLNCLHIGQSLPNLLCYRTVSQKTFTMAQWSTQRNKIYFLRERIFIRGREFCRYFKISGLNLKLLLIFFKLVIGLGSNSGSLGYFGRQIGRKSYEDKNLFVEHININKSMNSKDCLLELYIGHEWLGFSNPMAINWGLSRKCIVCSGKLRKILIAMPLEAVRQVYSLQLNSKFFLEI